MTTFITIIFVIVALVMVLSILLQSGKGGGLGSALGGGASQSVFGGGSGADFMSKLTQGFAATFMITAMYLAYASAHAGSDFLAAEDEGSEGVFESDQAIDAERLGPNPLTLPTAEEGERMRAAASTAVPAQSEIDPAALDASVPAEDPAAPSEDPTPGDDPAAPADDAPADDAPADTPTDAADGADPNAAKSRGDSPDTERGDSPQGGQDDLQHPVPNQPAKGPANAGDAEGSKPG